MATFPSDSDSKLVTLGGLKRFNQNLGQSSGSSTGGGATKVKLLGDCEIGDIVYINENHIGREYVVIQKGNPDPSIYDASCDGVWLMKETAYDNKLVAWGDDNLYKNSDIYVRLNSEFLGTIDTKIRSLIKTVKIPFVDDPMYQSGTYVLRNGDEGLPCKVFCLSAKEIGITNMGAMQPGSKLSYFPEGRHDATNILERYYKLGPSWSYTYKCPLAAPWWTRSVNTSSDKRAIYISDRGTTTGADPGTAMAQDRPVFILPSTLYVDSDGYITP